MSVYVDAAYWSMGRMVMCHMVADSLDELHQMADNIGLKREWFQCNASTPHYDLSISKRELALKNGAYSVNCVEMARITRRLRREGM